MDTGEDGEEGEGPGEEEGDAGENKETQGETTFVWLSLIKEYSDMTKTPWSEVWNTNICEFLNIIRFCREYNKREKENIKKWKAR